MDAFDFGVSSAFWLTIFASFLCVVYGAINWNKGKESEATKQSLKEWGREEDLIKEEL